MTDLARRRARLTIDIDPELRRRLADAAAEQGVSESDVVEAALRDRLAGELSAANRVKQERRMTPEEQERGLRALEELERYSDELLAERQGRLFEPSWKLLEEAREERTRQLMGEG